ncbi:MAG: YkgJ family cysteine cluster protein [Nitrospirales bacterium]|nr:YkgJ family cysteine cluster protein [Nitrospira sp.]MDR4501100.1 YkgJ family cysteine cluster protein [Nitrospirales bacterium]
MSAVPQFVPSRICFNCDVCCRFPERDSFLRPYFTRSEIEMAIQHGVSPEHFANRGGSQIEVVPHPSGEGYLCPAFDLSTSRCRIYEARPFDCQLYPLVLMWDDRHDEIQLGWDTKCPFLSPAGSDVPFSQDLSKLTVPPPLPEEIMQQAKRVADRLEEGAWHDQIIQHPHLVTPFQDDVVILRSLPRLTNAVGRPNA